MVTDDVVYLSVCFCYLCWSFRMVKEKEQYGLKVVIQNSYQTRSLPEYQMTGIGCRDPRKLADRCPANQVVNLG